MYKTIIGLLCAKLAIITFVLAILGLFNVYTFIIALMFGIIFFYCIWLQIRARYYK